MAPLRCGNCWSGPRRRTTDAAVCGELSLLFDFSGYPGGHRDRGHPQRADQLLDHHRSVRCIRAAERLGTGIHLCRGSELHLRHGAISGAVRQRHQLRAASGTAGRRVLPGDGPCSGGRAAGPVSGHPAGEAEVLLCHGEHAGGVPVGTDLHQRHVHRVCVHRDQHHRGLRAGDGQGQRPQSDRHHPVPVHEPGGVRAVPDRADHFEQHHRLSADALSGGGSGGAAALGELHAPADGGCRAAGGGTGRQERHVPLPPVAAGCPRRRHHSVLRHLVRLGAEGVHRAAAGDDPAGFLHGADGGAGSHRRDPGLWAAGNDSGLSGCYAGEPYQADAGVFLRGAGGVYLHGCGPGEHRGADRLLFPYPGPCLLQAAAVSLRRQTLRRQRPPQEPEEPAGQRLPGHWGGLGLHCGCPVHDRHPPVRRLCLQALLCQRGRAHRYDGDDPADHRPVHGAERTVLCSGAAGHLGEAPGGG